MKKIDKSDMGCLAWAVAILLINAVGIYIVRTNENIRWIVEGYFWGAFFFIFIASLLLSAVKGKAGDFFQGLAWYIRFVMLAFVPIYLASVMK